MSSWSRLRSKRGLRNLALTGAASAASAGLGAVATTPESDWYARLDKPAWQPPPLAFPLVWTPLYADIAATTAAALTRLEEEGRTEEAEGLRRSLALNLVLNPAGACCSGGCVARGSRPPGAAYSPGSRCSSLGDSATSTLRCTTPGRRTPPGACSRQH